MKITILTIGSRGDVQPFVALAKGLQAAGHSVVLATHEEFRGFVTEHDLEFRAYTPLLSSSIFCSCSTHCLDWAETHAN